jgi:putative oxidoreductase
MLPLAIRGEIAMAFLGKYQPQLLSILRIVAGLLFLEHGTQKILGFPAMVMTIPPEQHTIIMVAGYIELIGGALLFLGLFTRIVAFICSGEMAAAYWLVHFKASPFPAVNGGDAAILFCFVFLFIAAAGPGPIALSRD